MSAVTFDAWIEAVFNHPPEEPEWYWDKHFDDYWTTLGLNDALKVDYLTRLCLAPGHLGSYSLEQVAQGIWFLIGESSPGSFAHALLEPGVPLSQRTGCHAFENFFRAFVAPRAPGSADDENNAFHGACYMWWDIFPTYGNPKDGESGLDAACLTAMAAILKIPCELCQLSALHGLNHWHLNYPGEVESIVDTFRQTTQKLTPRIIHYAAIARSGRAL